MAGFNNHNFGGPNGKGFQLDLSKYTNPSSKVQSYYGGRQEDLMSELKGQIRDEDCDAMGIPRGSFWGEAPIDSWYPFKSGPPGKMGQAVNPEYMDYLTLADGSKLPPGAVWANPVQRVNGNTAEYDKWKASPQAVNGGSHLTKRH
jgi:hypothetical protein